MSESAQNTLEMSKKAIKHRLSSMIVEANKEASRLYKAGTRTKTADYLLQLTITVAGLAGAAGAATGFTGAAAASGIAGIVAFVASIAGGLREKTDAKARQQLRFGDQWHGLSSDLSDLDAALDDEKTTIGEANRQYQTLKRRDQQLRSAENPAATGRLSNRRDAAG